MEVIAPSQTTKLVYRIFCREAEEMPIFIKDWYLDAVCVDGDWEVFIIQKDREVIGAFVYYVKEKFNFRYITMPHLTKWMGLYIAPHHYTFKNEHNILKQVLSTLPKIASYQQNFHPSLLSWSPFYWKKYKQTTAYSYQIRLNQPKEVMMSAFSRNVKQYIRKASKKVELRHDLAPQQFYNVNKMSFNRQKINIPYSYDLFLKHHEALQKNNCGKILYAIDKEENIHSVCYLTWDKQKCYYHLAGDNPDYRSSGASIFLVWEAILYAKETLKLEIFDFEGSMIEGVARIRRQFGAYPIPYNVIWKYNSRLFRWISKIKNR